MPEEKYVRRLSPAEKVKVALTNEATFLRSIGAHIAADYVQTGLDAMGEASLERIGRELGLG